MANFSPNISPYPFQFDPSQWSNKYSPYAGVPLPSLAAYAGVPTDAHGNPIASYQQAQQAAAAAAAAPPAPPVMPPSTTLNSSPAMATPSPVNSLFYGMNPGGSGPGPAFGGTDPAFTPGAAPAAATPPPAPTPAGPDMNQAYLAALANPGQVQTPGATVPQAPLPSGQSGVLQQFLQGWQNKGSPTTGAGNYNNAGFFNALQGGQNANPS